MLSTPALAELVQRPDFLLPEQQMTEAWFERGTNLGSGFLLDSCPGMTCDVRRTRTHRPDDLYVAVPATLAL